MIKRPFVGQMCTVTMVLCQSHQFNISRELPSNKHTDSRVLLFSKWKYHPSNKSEAVQLDYHSSLLTGYCNSALTGLLASVRVLLTALLPLIVCSSTLTTAISQKGNAPMCSVCPGSTVRSLSPSLGAGH